MNHAHRVDVLAKAADMNLAHHAHVPVKVATNLVHPADRRQKADMLSAKSAKALLKKDLKAALKRSALIVLLVQPVKKAVVRGLQVMVARAKVAMENVLHVSAATMKVVQVQTIQISFS